jgi:hypothetical protein
MTDIAPFEARAAEAERRLAALEVKLLGGGLPLDGGCQLSVSQPTSGGGGGSNGDGDSAFKKLMLGQLLDLRSSLGRARLETQALEKTAAEATETSARFCLEAFKTMNSKPKS